MDSRSLEEQTRRRFPRRRLCGGGRPIRLSIGISVWAFLLFSCGTQENRPEKTVPEKIPSSILEKATIILTAQGKKEAVIFADTLISFEEEDSTIAKVVKVDFYDEKGEFRSTLTSEKGLVRQKVKEFSVWGNVIVENDTAKLETHSLRWDPNTRLITTEEFVKFQRGNDIVTGYGMKADNRLDNVKILRDVKGSFTDVPEGEKEPDEVEGDSGK